MNTYSINPLDNSNMKTQSSIDTQSKSTTPLFALVDRISGNFGPSAHGNRSHIINNVSEEIFLQVCEEKVASVLSGLLQIVIGNSENSCVRISAKLFNNVVLLHLKDDGCVNYDSISLHLTDVQKQAEKIGGFVGFTSYRNKLTTIAFSFTNHPDRRPDLLN